MMASRQDRANGPLSSQSAMRISWTRNRSGSGTSAVGDSRALICSMRKCACSSSGLRRKGLLRISARSLAKVGAPSRMGTLGVSSSWSTRASTSPINSESLDSQARRTSSRRIRDGTERRLTIRGLTPVRSDGSCDRPGPCVLRAEIAMIPAGVEEGRTARFVPEQPALDDSGRGAYHKTWDIEGSLARRGITPRSIRGTPIGGVAPGPRIDRGGYPPISEPEIAFVVLHDQPDARAAQRRPGAEHRARPVLPEARPTVCRGRADLF